jgi:hypothetical protein
LKLAQNIDLYPKYVQILRILKGFFDVGSANMFFDMERRKIVLFDLSSTKPWWLDEKGRINPNKSQGAAVNGQ